MLALLITLATSWAEPLHTGIPVEGIEGLSSPIFQTSTTGWWAQIPRGTVQVYVGESDEEASLWVEKMKEKMFKYQPKVNEAFMTLTTATEAFGDGLGLIIARDQNIGFMVRHDGQAQEWARTLHASIVDIDVPRFEPATLKKDGNEWIVEHPEGVIHLSFQGGQTTHSPSLRFSEPPKYLVIWDRWGRAVRADLGATDQGVEATPMP